MIGSSRETVARLLADFRRKLLVRVVGSTLVLGSKADLQAIVNG